MRSVHRCLLPFVAASAILHAADHTSWTAYLGGPDSSQYSALKQINKTNVKQLEIAWTYPTGDEGNYLFNPIIVYGVVYVLAKSKSVAALDARTGRETMGPREYRRCRHSRYQLLGKQRPL
jgi:quinoprotein glucose dehydrogenase